MLVRERNGYGLLKKSDDGYGFRTRTRTPGYGVHPKFAIFLRVWDVFFENFKIVLSMRKTCVQK